MKLTRKNIHDLKTKAGGFKYKTIEALGEKTPPTSGWIDRLVGKEITQEQYNKAVKYSNSVKHKRLPNHDMIKPLELHIVYKINGQLKEAIKYWRLDVAELVLDRLGAEYWEIGIGCKPHLWDQIEKEYSDIMYLNKKSGLRSHYWDPKNNDTYCRMWSTGGIGRKKSYEVSHKNKCANICTMCTRVMKNKAEGVLQK